MRLPSPRIENFRQEVELTDEQRLAVLKWAAQWAGFPAYPVRELLPELEAGFQGNVGRRDGSPAEKILRVAGHHIAAERTMNGWLRTRPAFPYSTLRKADGYPCCTASQARLNRVIRTKNIESLPLDDCDQVHCPCWWTAFTQGQVDRGEVELPLNLESRRHAPAGQRNW